MPNVYDMRPAATLSVRLPDASNGARGRCPAAASWPYSVDVMPTITPQRSRSAALILRDKKHFTEPCRTACMCSCTRMSSARYLPVEAGHHKVRTGSRLPKFFARQAMSRSIISGKC